MPRLRVSRIVAPIAAACALAPALAWGQMTPPNSDPLAPKQQTDPRNPPRFQKMNRAPYAQAPGTSVFAPTTSGAGRTGFDSTNARKKVQTRSVRTTVPQTSQTATPMVTSPSNLSPYQKPPATRAFAQAPNTPPIEIGPIRRPPPKRKPNPEVDPYAQLGLHAGGFTLYPAIELIGGYDTNPGRHPDAKGAMLYSVQPELRAQSNWSRHELKADLRGSYTGYNPDETPSLSRPYANGKVDGRVDVTRQTRVDLSGRVLVSTDNPNSPNLQAGLSKLPVYVTYGGNAGLGHRFNRFDVSIKGDAERTVYQESQLVNGTAASNDDRNYNQYGVKLRGGYDLSPGIMPFVEGTMDQRKHDLTTDFSGYQRDSNGSVVSVGSTFELSRLLTGEMSVGYMQRKYDDPRLEKIGGLIGNASLIWTASTLTTVKLTGGSTIGETTIPGVSGILYRDVGLQVDHAFRRWLIGSAKVGFGVDDYVGMERKDNRFSLGAGLTFKVDRNIQFKGEFRQDWMRSNVSGVDYAASIFMLGLRVQQ